MRKKYFTKQMKLTILNTLLELYGRAYIEAKLGMKGVNSIDMANYELKFWIKKWIKGI